MSYIDGFVCAVPTSNKEAYRKLATTAATVFKDNGAIRVVEAWADDVADGKVTDFKRAVQSKADETVVFSWVEWPSKEARDAGSKKSMEDPRMQSDEYKKVFDGQRMIYGGFAPILDT